MNHVTMTSRYTLRCRRCGDEQVVEPGCDVPMLAETFHAYARIHASCARPEVSGLRFRFHEPRDWLGGEDARGAALALWSGLSGQPGDGSPPDPPRDAEDFSRCYRLLLAFPAWAARLEEVGARHPIWSPYVARWNELVALYEKGLPTGDFTALDDLLRQIHSRAA